MESIRELHVITHAMSEYGFHLARAEPGPMDSGVVEFSDGKKQITATKDRFQWMRSGDRSDLKPFGLWRAFDRTSDFRDALVAYVQKKKA